MGGMNMPRVMKKNEMPGGGHVEYDMGGKMDMGHGGDMARAIKIYLMRKGGKTFPDLTGDGKVTFADILKGRKVKLKKKSQAYGGMVMENGGKSDPPRIEDLSNIRLLQGPDGNQYFLKQGEDQYSPLGGGKQLRETLGRDRFQEYMADLGLSPRTDEMGNIIPGFTASQGVKDPYARASAQFREEAFGDRSRQQALADEYFAENQGSEVVQQFANRVPAFKGRPDLQAMEVYRAFSPATLKRLQSDFLLRTLGGGQRGDQGGQ